MSNYYVKHVSSSLTLKDASGSLEHALSIARENKLLPIAIVILDSGGNPVAFKREDGCGIMRIDIATVKAWGAWEFLVEQLAID